MTDTEIPEPSRLSPDVLAAEKAVIGTILSARTAAENILAVLDEDCFRVNEHQAVFAAVRHVAETGGTLDPASVLGRLVAAEQGVWRTGTAGVILAGLMEHATPAYMAHARTVLTAARTRALASVAPRIAQMTSAPGFDPDEGTDRIRRLIDEAAGKGDRTCALRTQAEIFEDVVGQLERGVEPGLRTGYSDLDEATGGLRPGTLTVIGARPGVGKALALDTPIPTPRGWTTMKDIQPGDYVFGMDGKPALVTAATGVMYDHSCYDVEFSDGTVITADAEHLWLTETRASRRAATPPGSYVFNRTSPFSHDQRWKSEKPGVKTTETIYRTLRTGSDGRLNHSIPLAAPLELPETDLPIDPYILGYWLGDGHSHHASITVGDADLSNLLDHVQAAGYFHSKPTGGPAAWLLRISTQPVRKGGDQKGRDSLQGRLRNSNLICNKHIPDAYMRSSEPQRRALLAGLLDSDGTISASGRVSLDLTNRRLAEQAMELIATLGYQPRMGRKRVNGRSQETSICYRVGFVTTDRVFHLPRKDARRPAAVRPSSSRRYIVTMRPVRSTPVRCIAVDSPDRMYLAGWTCVPTHNSVLAGCIADHVGTRLGLPVLFASLEMTAEELMHRRMAARARVPLDVITKGTLTDRDWDRLAAAREYLTESAITVDDEPDVSLAHVAARLRGMERDQAPARLAVIDYLGLLKEPKAENRQVAVAQLARECKNLARRYRLPVVLLVQVRREAEHRQGKVPLMSDLRESGEIEAAADIVLLLHREDAYEMESPRAGEADIIVAKNRQGARCTITVAFQGHYGRMVGMTRDDVNLSESEWSPSTVIGGAA